VFFLFLDFRSQHWPWDGGPFLLPHLGDFRLGFFPGPAIGGIGFFLCATARYVAARPESSVLYFFFFS